jgi:hypothetical protein
MPTMKFTLRSLFLAVTFSCAGGVACAQSGDTIVEIPTAQGGSVRIEIPTAHKQAADSNSDTDMTMAGEYKSTKNVVQEEKEALSWTLNFQVGYWSEYLFRGTNLTPDSDGIEYQQAYFSTRGFTLGLWFASQLGNAVVPNATVVGEAGGGFSPYGPPAFGAHEDFATQFRFKELDVFSSYTHSFGPIDVTVGNIAFFIFRSEVDRYVNLANGTFQDFAVPEDEKFDRIFLALSTSKIHPFGISIIPTVTYYQTIYNHVDPIVTPGGAGPSNAEVTIGGNVVVDCDPATPCSDSQYEAFLLAFKRNDKLGGYAEGKIQAVIPIIENRLRLEPTALISYSAGDRSESINLSQAQFLASAVAGHPLSSAKPLYGFNHFQGSAQLVLQITRELSLSGFGAYAYHIANPTAGTDKNEEWGGVYATLSF